MSCPEMIFFWLYRVVLWCHAAVLARVGACGSGAVAGVLAERCGVAACGAGLLVMGALR